MVKLLKRLLGLPVAFENVLLEGLTASFGDVLNPLHGKKDFNLEINSFPLELFDSLSFVVKFVICNMIYSFLRPMLIVTV